MTTRNFLWAVTALLLFFMSCNYGKYDGAPGVYDREAGKMGDNYADYADNPFILSDTQAVSTFSVDADGGSYANIKRYILDEGQKPPANAVRIEEMLNYFPMDYAGPTDQHPIALNGEVADCPWNPAHKLIRIGIKGKTLDPLPATNWVLLVDVSGSMNSDDKLDLAKKGLVKFVEETLRPTDRLAIVTYAGAVETLLPSTPGNEKAKMIEAIEDLKSGGSTAGAQAIVMAYDIAAAHKIEDGNNRIVLITDGDFNVGMSSTEALVELVESKRDEGIFLSTIGVGRGNFNDAMMEQIADNGNGTFEYMGDEEQAHKVLVTEFGKFYTVAKDVKVQVQFNPENVVKYRLIGYENRVLEQSDFTNDAKDAGEIGSGQNVTALYEIEPKAGGTLNLPLFTVDFRYKLPNSDVSEPISLTIPDNGHSFEQASDHLQFAASVAAFGMLLRDSPYKGSCTYDKVLEWFDQSGSYDPGGYRATFKALVKKAKTL